MDIDGDGAWEIPVEVSPTSTDNNLDLTYWAVLRVRDTWNEIIWLGLVDGSVWAGSSTRVKPIWRDEDQDGTTDLVFITVVMARGPQGGVVFKPPETVAIFELDRASGLLRPKLLPADCGITSWSPPDNAPVRIDQTADLEPVFRALLPIPDQQAE